MTVQLEPLWHILSLTRTLTAHGIETLKVCSLAPPVWLHVTWQASWLWFFVLLQHPLEMTQILTSSVWRWHWTLLRKRWNKLIQSLWIVHIYIPKKLTVLSTHNVLCTWYDSTISTFLCLWLGNLSNGVHSVLLWQIGTLHVLCINKCWPLAGLFPLFFWFQVSRVRCPHMASNVTTTSLLLLYSRGCDMQPPGGHGRDHRERGEAVPLLRWNGDQPDPRSGGRSGATPEVILPAHHTLGVHLIFFDLLFSTVKTQLIFICSNFTKYRFGGND